MKRQLLATITLSLFSTLTFAHPEHAVSGFTTGFIHPLTGWDHLLVMLGVGALAGKVGSGALWKLPLTFMIMMLVGALFGAIGFAFAGMETVIATSVMVMGLLLILTLRLGTMLQIILIASFAFMHGLAHGVELMGVASLLGMLAGTASLHVSGIGLVMTRVKLAKFLYQLLAWVMMLLGSYWVLV